MKVKTVRAVQIAHWANRLGHNVKAGLLFLVCKHSLLKFCRLKRKKASQDKKYPAEAVLSHSPKLQSLKFTPDRGLCMKTICCSIIYPLLFIKAYYQKSIPRLQGYSRESSSRIPLFRIKETGLNHVSHEVGSRKGKQSDCQTSSRLV